MRQYVVRVVNQGTDHWLFNNGREWAWTPNRFKAFAFCSSHIAEKTGIIHDRRKGGIRHVERASWVADR